MVAGYGVLLSAERQESGHERTRAILADRAGSPLFLVQLPSSRSTTHQFAVNTELDRSVPAFIRSVISVVGCCRWRTAHQRARQGRRNVLLGLELRGQLLNHTTKTPSRAISFNSAMARSSGSSHSCATLQATCRKMLFGLVRDRCVLSECRGRAEEDHKKAHEIGNFPKSAHGLVPIARDSYHSAVQWDIT